MLVCVSLKCKIKCLFYSLMLHENVFVGLKKFFLKFYEVGSERGISIDADSGPPRYVL